MIKYLLLFLLPLSLYASKILSYNIYERSDRADIMITFDTPFTGSIKQSKGNRKIIIKLNDASIESTKNKKINSDFLHSIIITPLKNQVQILANISPNVKLTASKTADAYGLRLRFTAKSLVKKKANSTLQTDLSALPMKSETGPSARYYFVVGILIIGIIILFIFNKKLQKLPKKKPKDSWLFNAIQEKQVQKTTQKEASTQPSSTKKEQSSEISIRFQKALNSSNSVVMLDFGEESYLVLMGNSNILLDKFRENKPASEQEFHQILQERNQELEDFIGSPKKTQESIPKEALQAYKERAALIYGDEE